MLKELELEVKNHIRKLTIFVYIKCLINIFNISNNHVLYLVQQRGVQTQITCTTIMGFVTFSPSENGISYSM